MKNEPKRKFWKSNAFVGVAMGSLLSVYAVLFAKLLFWLIEL